MRVCISCGQHCPVAGRSHTLSQFCTNLLLTFRTRLFTRDGRSSASASCRSRYVLTSVHLHPTGMRQLQYRVLVDKSLALIESGRAMVRACYTAGSRLGLWDVESYSTHVLRGPQMTSTLYHRHLAPSSYVRPQSTAPHFVRSFLEFIRCRTRGDGYCVAQTCSLFCLLPKLKTF